MTREIEGPDGFRYFPGALDEAAQAALLAELRQALTLAPLFQPRMPKSGNPMSVQMSNLGPLGWVTDQAHGYRYQATHPVTGVAWPPIPNVLLDLWRRLAGYSHLPEACLVNYYGPGARMGSHVDADEADKSAPVLSVSLGDSAVFHVGGAKRSDPKLRIKLHSGDVAILGGPARRHYHGIDRVLAGSSRLLSEGGRFNLTLRRVTLP